MTSTRYFTSFTFAFTLALVSLSCWAQAQSEVSSSAASGLLSTEAVKRANIPWPSLSPRQRIALLPLAPFWMALPINQQKNWLFVAKNYGNLSAQQQKNLHDNMLSWVHLAPKARVQARINFTMLKNLSQAKRLQEWERYMALSAEERAKLAEQAKKTKQKKSPPLEIPAQTAYPPYSIIERFKMEGVKFGS